MLLLLKPLGFSQQDSVTWEVIWHFKSYILIFPKCVWIELRDPSGYLLFNCWNIIMFLKYLLILLCLPSPNKKKNDNIYLRFRWCLKLWQVSTPPCGKEISHIMSTYRFCCLVSFLVLYQCSFISEVNVIIAVLLSCWGNFFLNSCVVSYNSASHLNSLFIQAVVVEAF